MAFTGVASNLIASQNCVANTTGTQASALTSSQSQILQTSQAVQITTTGASQSTVLPPSTPGLQIDVYNITTGNATLVFPYPGDTINLLALNASITMNASTSTTFCCLVQGQWWTNPRVPS